MSDLTGLPDLPDGYVWELAEGEPTGRHPYINVNIKRSLVVVEEWSEWTDGYMRAPYGAWSFGNRPMPEHENRSAGKDKWEHRTRQVIRASSQTVGYVTHKPNTLPKNEEIVAVAQKIYDEWIVQFNLAQAKNDLFGEYPPKTLDA